MSGGNTEDIEAERDELAEALRRLTNLHDNEVFVCGVDDESVVRDVLSAARAALAKAGVT